MSSLPPISSGGNPASSQSKLLKKRKECTASSIKKPTKKRVHSQAIIHPKNRDPFRLRIPIQPKAGPWYQPLQAMLRPILAQTTYGKNLDRLLSPEQDFSAVSLPGGSISLRNYNTIRPTDRPPFKGVCNELALNMAHYLKQQFGHTLTIQMLKGTCQDYYPDGIHYYLIMWPPTRDEAMNGQLRASQNLPESALVVDPSFQRAFCPQDNPQESQKYKQERSFPLKGNFFQNISPNANLSDLPVLLPVGFLKDLIPELTASYGQQALLYLEYDKPRADKLSPPITPVIQPHANSMEFELALNCLSQIHSEHPLHQLYNRLISDVTPSPPSPMSSNETASSELDLDTDYALREWQTYQRSIPTQPSSPINPFQAALPTPTGNASIEPEQQTVSPVPLPLQPPLLPSATFLVDSLQPEIAPTSLLSPFPEGIFTDNSSQAEEAPNHLPSPPTWTSPLYEYLFQIDPRQPKLPDPPEFQHRPVYPEIPVEPLIR